MLDVLIGFYYEYIDDFSESILPKGPRESLIGMENIKLQFSYLSMSFVVQNSAIGFSCYWLVQAQDPLANIQEV